MAVLQLVLFKNICVLRVWKHLIPEQGDLKAGSSSFLKMQFPKCIYTCIFLFVLFSFQHINKWSFLRVWLLFSAFLIAVFKVLSVEVMHC